MSRGNRPRSVSQLLTFSQRQRTRWQVAAISVMSRSDESTGDESNESARSSAVSSPEPLEYTTVSLKPSYIDCSDESLKGEKAMLCLAGRSRLFFVLIVLLPLLAGVFVTSRNPEMRSFLSPKDFLSRPHREKFTLATPTTTKGIATTIRPRRFRPIVSNRSPDAPIPLVEKNAPEFVLPELFKFLAFRSNEKGKAEHARPEAEPPPPPFVGRTRPKSIRDMIRPPQPPKAGGPRRYSSIRVGASSRRHVAIRIRRVGR